MTYNVFGGTLSLTQAINQSIFQQDTAFSHLTGPDLFLVYRRPQTTCLHLLLSYKGKGGLFLMVSLGGVLISLTWALSP